MKPVTGVWGISGQEAVIGAALEQLRRKGYQNVQIFSPIPCEDMLEVREFPKSPIRCYTLAGGILGFLCGLALPIWTSLQWPLRTGGKPIVSIPPFLVVTFELTVLFAGLFTVAGLLVHGGFLRSGGQSGPLSATGFQSRFSVDLFGVLVPCEPANRAEIEQLFRAAGVEETSIEGG